jgi:hypothetical protein
MKKVELGKYQSAKTNYFMIKLWEKYKMFESN